MKVRPCGLSMLLGICLRARGSNTDFYTCDTADWLRHPLHLDVSYCLMVSVNDGEWHGSAAFYRDRFGRRCWLLTFNWQTYEGVKTVLYTQLDETETYLHIGSPVSNQYNSMLIEKHG